MTASLAIGDHLRDWRQRRRMSQLDLACEADISTRHLSFLETGRARPSRDMVLHLAERLEVPLRQRNVLLIAAGYAPFFAERALDHPALAAARAAIDQVLAGHEPYPALAVDRHWQLAAANQAAQRLMDGVAPHLLRPPVNVMRVALHPEGLAPRTENLAEWRTHLLDRLARQVETTGDPVLAALSEELSGYPGPARRAVAAAPEPVVLPLRLRAGDTVLAFFSTTTVFGMPNDITLSELAIEAFFPADAATGEALRRMAAIPA